MSAFTDDPAATLIRRSYDAFAKGDVPEVLRALSGDIRWRVPGRSPLSGDYVGHAGVQDFFGRCMELSDGTLRVQPDTVLADGSGRVVVLATVSADRRNVAWSSPEVHVWQARDGRAVEFVEFQGDQQAEDEFWLL